MKLLRLIALSLLVAVVSALGAEVMLRFLKPSALQYYRNLKIIHSYHPDYNVALEPNQDVFVKQHEGIWSGQFTTNSFGMRGSPETSVAKPRIACLGDSLVFGLGVSDEATFCRKLDGIELDGKKFESVNFGVDAYGSYEDALRLEDMAAKTPGLEKVLFFVSPNDFTLPKELRDQGILADDENTAERRNNPAFKSNFRFQFEATRVSYLVHALKLAYEQVNLQVRITVAGYENDLREAGILPPKGTLKSIGFWHYLYSVFYHPPAKKQCNPKPVTANGPMCPEAVPDYIQCESESAVLAKSSDPLPPLTVESYDRMISYTQKNKMQLIVIILPMQVEEMFCYANGKSHPLRNYAIRSLGYFRGKGIKTIDLMSYTPRMCGQPFQDKFHRELKSGIRDMFIPGDGHLTVLGNQWAADAIKDALQGKTR